jgi:hypothetical protein
VTGVSGPASVWIRGTTVIRSGESSTELSMKKEPIDRQRTQTRDKGCELSPNTRAASTTVMKPLP